jgi:hypothetical protein
MCAAQSKENCKFSVKLNTFFFLFVYTEHMHRINWLIHHQALEKTNSNNWHLIALFFAVYLAHGSVLNYLINYIYVARISEREI